MKDEIMQEADVEKMLTYVEETALFDELKKLGMPLKYKIIKADNAFEASPENNGIIIVKPEENSIRLYYSKSNENSFPIRGDGMDESEEQIDFYSRLEFEADIVKINSTYRKKYVVDLNDPEQRMQKGLNEEIREEEGIFYLDANGRLCFKSNLNRELTLYSSCQNSFGNHTFKSGLGRKLKSMIAFQ